MAHPRPFRFALNADPTDSRAKWVAQARRVEETGFSTLILSDHISAGGFSPLLGLLSAADATDHLRFGTHVLSTDFHNPVMLAQEIATFDLLSDGRLELGLGTGWLTTDYDAAGITFAPQAVRMERLVETVRLLKLLIGDEPVTFEGKHFHIRDAMLYVKPLQRPHPPIFIGGGGKRILSFAAREANIVGINPKTTPAGQLDGSTVGVDATQQKINWIREAAGQRFEEVELHVIVNRVIVTDDRRRGLADLATWIDSFPPSIVTNYDTSPQGLLDSPHFLVGSVEQIVADIQERRERFGISYYTLFFDTDAWPQIERIVEHLAGA